MKREALWYAAIIVLFLVLAALCWALIHGVMR